MGRNNRHEEEKDPFDFSEAIEEIKDLLDDEEDSDRRQLLKGLLGQYELDLKKSFDEMDRKMGRYSKLPPPPPRGKDGLAFTETKQLNDFFQRKPVRPLKIQMGEKTLRELLTRLDPVDRYNFCKYVQRYDMVAASAEEQLDAIHEAFWKNPVMLLYPFAEDQMQEVLSLPKLASEGGEYQGKELISLALCCLASFDKKTATLTLCADYEGLFQQITPQKIEKTRRLVSRFDTSMDVLMHHYGLIEMDEIPGQLKEIFQMEISEKRCNELVYFRLSIPERYQTLTNLNEGRHYLVEKGLDVNHIMQGLMYGEFMIPYWKPSEFELKQLQAGKCYIDIFPGWSYLLGLFVANMGVEKKEARNLCDEYFRDVRSGESLKDIMRDLMGESEQNAMLVPRLMIWETSLHFFLGTPLPGLKGATRVIADQMPGYFVRDAVWAMDAVKEDQIKKDTHIEDMPQAIQREIGSRLFTLEESDLAPLKMLQQKYAHNIDINYLYGVACERLAHLEEAVKAFEQVDRMLKGADPTVKAALSLVRDGKIRKPVYCTSDGTIIFG